MEISEKCLSWVHLRSTTMPNTVTTALNGADFRTRQCWKWKKSCLWKSLVVSCYPRASRLTCKYTCNRGRFVFVLKFVDNRVKRAWWRWSLPTSFRIVDSVTVWSIASILRQPNRIFVDTSDGDGSPRCAPPLINQSLPYQPAKKEYRTASDGGV